MVLNNSFPELVIPNIDFYSYNVNKLKRNRDRVAMVDAASDQQLTLGNIHDASIKLASALTRRGLNKQEIVALCASSCIEYSLVILGVAACNAITTTCNPQYSKVETQKQFQNCQPKFVICDSDQVHKILKIAKEVASIQEVISVDKSGLCTDLWSIINSDDGTCFPFDVKFDVDDDVVILPYSSGTTGLPKGVMLTHKNMVSVHHIFSAQIRIPDDSVYYSFLPMFHIYGMNQTFRILDNGKLVVDKRFNLERLLKGIQKYKVTSFNGVPSTFISLLESRVARNYDLSSLRSITSGGSPLPPNLAEKAIQEMRVAVFHGWGLTETSGFCAGGMLSTKQTDTVGSICAMSRLKVVDPVTREELRVNQTGELLFISPGVMKGYYKNPKANAEIFENGWLRTGDIGRYDQNGLVYITDRMKELIKYKGFQVAPAELESLLLDHPKIRDAGVVGVPDATAGEVPRAFVVRRDSSLTAEEVQLFVESKVSSYKYIRGGVFFLNEIPRSQAGKILRRNLAKLPVNKSKL